MANSVNELVSREEVEHLVEKLNLNASDRERYYEDAEFCRKQDAEKDRIFQRLRDLNVEVMYTPIDDIGYYVNEDQLAKFKTGKRLDAERVIEHLNDMVDKQSRARSDEKRAGYAETINEGLAWLQRNGVEYSQDRWSGRYSLPRTEEQEKQLATDLREYYLEGTKRDVEAKRHEIVQRMESEIRSLQQELDRMKVGNWDSVWSSSISSTNRGSIIKLIDEQRLMNEMVQKLG